jgi:hypothetical protein
MSNPGYGEGNHTKDASKTIRGGLPVFLSDFQCFVCGSIFTTDDDRKQHLEKESHGEPEDRSSPDNILIAAKQQEINDAREHYF